jgi:hypothetical protein
MPRASQVSEELKRRIEELRKRGYSIEEISKTLGVSYERVREVCRRSDIRELEEFKKVLEGYKLGSFENLDSQTFQNLKKNGYFIILSFVSSRSSGWKYHQIEEAEFGRRSESGRRLIGKLRDLEKLGMIRFNPESKRYVSTSEGNEFVEFVESLEEHLYERI